MGKRPFIAGERHHWWPKSLSQYWTDAEGLVSRLHAAGTVSRSTPNKTARISDGHNIKLNSPWDSTFEDFFDVPDNEFPRIVKLIESTVEQHERSKSKYRVHTLPDCELISLWNCLLSLVVRSPKFRNGILSFVHNIRADVKENEHRNLVAVNMKQAYENLRKGCNSRGKYMVIFSENREFIFGDGFYNNINSVSRNSLDVRILVPLTPKIAVLYVRSVRSCPEPRLVTYKATKKVMKMVNDTVQVYSNECIFFRYEKPVPSQAFLRQEHLVYSSGDPVLDLVEELSDIRL